MFSYLNVVNGCELFRTVLGEFISYVSSGVELMIALRFVLPSLPKFKFTYVLL